MVITPQESPVSAFVVLSLKRRIQKTVFFCSAESPFVLKKIDLSNFLHALCVNAPY